jgi:hypothetical protein
MSNQYPLVQGCNKCHKMLTPSLHHSLR